MNDLIMDAWAAWDAARSRYPDQVREQSAPVLWFGDLDRYCASRRRVVTIAVNPGPRTFPAEESGNPWAMLPGLSGADSRDPGHYTRALNAFQFDGWFRAFSPLLLPFGAQYHVGRCPRLECEPLHLDISPIATAAVWSRLRPEAQRFLRQQGLPLLSRLLRLLRPEAAFLSVSRPHFEAVRVGLGIEPGPLRQLNRHQVRRCDWSSPGELLWLRKMNQRPVNPGTLDASALGRWMAGGEDPTSAAGSAAAPARRSLEQVAGLFSEAFDNGAPREGHSSWKPTRSGPRWAHRICLAGPEGETVTLDSGGSPAGIGRFLRDWNLHQDTMRSGWGRKRAGRTDHVTFRVRLRDGTEEHRHYKGVYLRWDDCEL